MNEVHNQTRIPFLKEIQSTSKLVLYIVIICLIILTCLSIYFSIPSFPIMIMTIIGTIASLTYYFFMHRSRVFIERPHDDVYILQSKHSSVLGTLNQEKYILGYKRNYKTYIVAICIIAIFSIFDIISFFLFYRDLMFLGLILIVMIIAAIYACKRMMNMNSYPIKIMDSGLEIGRHIKWNEITDFFCYCIITREREISYIFEIHTDKEKFLWQTVSINQSKNSMSSPLLSMDLYCQELRQVIELIYNQTGYPLIDITSSLSVQVWPKIE